MTKLDERIWSIIDGCRDTVFITTGTGEFPRARTMNCLIDKDRSGGIFWFVTQLKSRKVQEIKKNPSVTLYFADKKTLDFACVFGKASICTDIEEKQRFWNDDWVHYWPEGVKSPDYILIKVIPEKGEFFLNETAESGIIEFKKK